MAYVKINGVGFSGASVEVSVENIGTFSNVKSINYGMSKELTKIDALGKTKSIGRTKGQKSADDASMDIGFDQYSTWVATAGGNDDFMDSVFDVTVNYRLEGQPLSSVKLVDCTPIAVSNAHASGAEELVVSITFSVMDLEG